MDRWAIVQIWMASTKMVASILQEARPSSEKKVLSKPLKPRASNSNGMTAWKHLVECSVPVFGGPLQELHPEL